MEGIKIDMSNLNDAQKDALKELLTKQLLKIALAKMTPEQRELFLLNIEREAYKAEIQKKLMKHQRVMKVLSLPLLPMTFLIAILKALLLKKIYINQILALAQNMKLLKASSQSLNLISPERQKKTKIQENYIS